MLFMTAYVYGPFLLQGWLIYYSGNFTVFPSL